MKCATCNNMAAWRTRPHCTPCAERIEAEDHRQELVSEFQTVVELVVDPNTKRALELLFELTQ